MGRPVRVGIDGRSAAGKTTVADELADRVRSSGRTCVRASIDDFHPPGYKHRAVARAFTPESYLREGYDYEAFRRLVLEPLSAGGDRRCRLKFWSSPDDVPFPDETVEVDEDSILIVDGFYLHLPILRAFWDFTIWMDVDRDTMLERASSRDVAWVGSAEIVRERYLTGWIPRHEQHEEAVRPRERSNVVVDNNDVDHPTLRYPTPRPGSVG